MTVAPYILSAIAAASRVVAIGGQTVRQAGLIGANLGGYEDYSDARVFVDLMKTVRSFGPTSNPYVYPTSSGAVLATLNAGGWPNQDFAIVVGDDLDRYTAGTGTYECSYSHPTQLTIAVSGCTVQNHRQHSAGVYRFELVLSGVKAPTLTFTGVGASLSNLRIIRPGYAWDTTQVFTTEWLAIAANYSILRMMDFMKTSGTITTGREYFCNGGQTDWATRWSPTGTAAGKIWERHSLEQVVEFANGTGKDVWVCIPHKATDDYITGMFNLLNSQINPGIKIYVEYSNEIWNTTAAYSPQYGWCQTKAKEELNWYGGTTLADDISSVTVASNVVTVNFVRAHGRTTGDQVLAKLGSSGVWVTAGRYTVTVTSPTQFTFPITGVADGSVTLSATSFIVMNHTSDLAYDFMTGSDASGNFWQAIQNQYYWGYRYAAKRLGQAKDLLAAINPGLIKTRFRFVAALQFANIAAFSQANFKYLQNQYGPVSNWLYAISGAPYVLSNSTDTTVDQVIATLQASLLTQRSRYQQWVAAAKSAGVEFLPYEIGTDLVIRATGNATVANAAGIDPRIQQITTDMMLDPGRYGSIASCFYIETSGHSGFGFPLRRSFTSSNADEPRLAGMNAALDATVPALASDWTNTAQPVDPAVSYEPSGYALYGPDMNLGYAIPSSKNLVFAGSTFSGALKPQFLFVSYVPADGQYDLVWQLGANTAGIVYNLSVDGVQTSTITPNIFGSVDSTACTDTPAVRLTLTKGWHVFKAQTTVNTSARCGARQFKLTPVA